METINERRDGMDKQAEQQRRAEFREWLEFHALIGWWDGASDGERAAFLRGFDLSTELFAVWRQGVQWAGLSHTVPQVAAMTRAMAEELPQVPVAASGFVVCNLCGARADRHMIGLPHWLHTGTVTDPEQRIACGTYVEPPVADPEDPTGTQRR